MGPSKLHGALLQKTEPGLTHLTLLRRNPNVCIGTIGSIDANGVVLHARVVDREELDLEEIQYRQVTLGDLLHLDKQRFAFLCVVLHLRRFDNSIHLLIAIAVGVRKRHALLDVVAPIETLDPDRRIGARVPVVSCECRKRSP